MQNNRKVYFDYLRVVATFGVVVMHIASSNWDARDVNGFPWQVFNFYDGLVRWGVPVFVMISGALFLDKEIKLSRIYSKYILRMAVAFVVWSVFYAFFAGGGIRKIVYQAIAGYYHMWFILMIIGLYACIPFIRPIAADEQKSKYFLLLSFVTVFALTQVNYLVHDFSGGIPVKLVDLIKDNIATLDIKMVMGFTSYYILGYHLSRIHLGRKHRAVIYVLGLISIMLTVVLNMFASIRAQAPSIHYFSNYSINVLLASIAIFVCFRNMQYNSTRLNSLMQKLSKYSFGAYLIHVMIWEQMNKMGYTIDTIDPVCSVPLFSIIVFVLSMAASAVLNHIPVINKYLV